VILSDRDLRERIERGDILIEPLDDPDLQIQPASVDLRLNRTFVVYRLPHVPCIDPRDPRTVERYTETRRSRMGRLSSQSRGSSPSPPPSSG
jgi:dCTP deaminase